MTAAMSSGLSPSRSNLKVTILSLCVCSWHSTTRSTLSESCTDGHDQWLTTGVCLLSKPPSKVKHRRNNVVLCVSKHVCESTVKYSVCCSTVLYVVMHELFVSACSPNIVIKRPQSVLIRGKMYCGDQGQKNITTDNVAQSGWSSTARS